MGAFGGFYSIRKELFEPLPGNAYANDDLLIPMHILRIGDKVIFDKEAISIKEASRSIEEEFRQRIKISAGHFQSFFLLLDMLSPARELPFFFYFSHKVLRWFSPFLLLGILVANGILIEYLPFTILFILQVIFYGITGVGLYYSRKKKQVPFISSIYHFVLINYADFLGFFGYLRIRGDKGEVIKELEKQREYWNKEKPKFDAIYSHKKDRLSNVIDKIFRKDMYQRFEYTMTNSGPIKDKTFLDVGCGTGRYTFEFIKRGCKHAIGIDISNLMIEHCKSIASQQEVQGKATFLQGDIFEITLKDTVDICIGIGLFDYIKEPLPVLIKMKEYSTDRVIVSFPRLWTWRAPVRKVRLFLRNCPVYFYSKKKIQELLNNTGFSDYTLEKVGKLYCVTAFINS
jgi:hypothetical protein